MRQLIEMVREMFPYTSPKDALAKIRSERESVISYLTDQANEHDSGEATFYLSLLYKDKDDKVWQKWHEKAIALDYPEALAYELVYLTEARRNHVGETVFSMEGHHQAVDIQRRLFDSGDRDRIDMWRSKVKQLSDFPYIEYYSDYDNGIDVLRGHIDVDIRPSTFRDNAVGYLKIRAQSEVFQFNTPNDAYSQYDLDSSSVREDEVYRNNYRNKQIILFLKKFADSESDAQRGEASFYLSRIYANTIATKSKENFAKYHQQALAANYPIALENELQYLEQGQHHHEGKSEEERVALALDLYLGLLETDNTEVIDAWNNKIARNKYFMFSKGILNKMPVSTVATLLRDRDELIHQSPLDYLANLAEDKIEESGEAALILSIYYKDKDYKQWQTWHEKALEHENPTAIYNELDRLSNNLLRYQSMYSSPNVNIKEEWQNQLVLINKYETSLQGKDVDAYKKWLQQKADPPLGQLLGNENLHEAYLALMEVKQIIDNEALSNLGVDWGERVKFWSSAPTTKESATVEKLRGELEDLRFQSPEQVGKLLKMAYETTDKALKRKKSRDEKLATAYDKIRGHAAPFVEETKATTKPLSKKERAQLRKEAQRNLFRL